MASNDIWSDYEGQSLRHGVKQNTVDRLKHILTGFNEECHSYLSKSGKKQDIIDRITTQMQTWRQQNSVDSWMKARAILYQVRNAGTYTPGRVSTSRTYPSAPVAVQHATSSHLSGSSSIGHYDPYAPPRKAQASASSSSGVTSTAVKSVVTFKSSPFFKIEQAVSPVVECPESSNASDRKSQTVSFTLNNDHLTKLMSNSSKKYQLRLFCTSSAFYMPGPNAFRSSAGPCPIEFPATCEVRVNNVQLTANLKGLKKKPGTAPPADLGKMIRLSGASPNRVELIYVNSQQNTPPKKYYLVVMLVEATNVDQLVENIRVNKRQNTSDILAKRATDDADDGDIVLGAQKMSLKCPLSFIRITTPCRSSSCVHPQCFEAASWFSVMEQTTTWLCPVCEKVLNPDDLIMDGYFEDILKACPDSVEDVVVESDGLWHTADNKYSSKEWKISHPPSIPVVKPPTPTPSASNTESPPRQKAKARGVEVTVLDSDDEDDEGRVKRELSPSCSGSSAAIGAVIPPQKTSTVIDLTIDSDDEDTPASAPVAKRKVDDIGLPSPTEQIWKKSRLDSVGALPLIIPRRDDAITSVRSPNEVFSPNHGHRSPINGLPRRPPLPHISSPRIPGQMPPPPLYVPPNGPISRLESSRNNYQSPVFRGRMPNGPSSGSSLSPRW